ncbi:hypothetical protein J6590_086328 [Homalodisca vitripennis]|nr:hypothetical protein J6590_086328 [Homalodisca vitripennis]
MVEIAGVEPTYNLDAQIGESSACATAHLCGVKANFETVGLDIRGKFGNCTSSFVSRVESLIDWAQTGRRCTRRCGLIRIKNAHRLLSCDVTSRHYPTTNGPSWLASSPPPDTVM